MSEKTLYMSYANIQGQEALIEHFRNSVVMDVPDEWRPTILKNGEVQEFPAVS